MQTELLLKEERVKAFYPFAFFSLLLVGMFLNTIIDIETRPELKKQSEQTAKAGPMQNRDAPDFEVPNLEGRNVKLSDYRGKVVFLNFWATWCPPCRDEMPSMERLYQKLKGPHFEMLAVSVDEEGASIVQPFVAEFKLTFPILIDPEKQGQPFKPGGISERYMITGFPETMIIGPDGIIFHHVVGPQKWDEESIVELLQLYIEKAVAASLNPSPAK